MNTETVAAAAAAAVMATDVTPAISSPTTTTNRGRYLNKSMDFGKFYQTSYLDMNGNVVKKGSISSPNLKPPTSFHRPENFSYSAPAPKFGKNKKSGMLSILTDCSPSRSPRTPERNVKNITVNRSPERPSDTEEVIKLSHYPGAQIKPKEIAPIEREDWPAPPASAVNNRNLVKAEIAKKLSRNDSDEETVQVDPKIKKELQEVSKIQDSGMVNIICADVSEQIQIENKKRLDPRSASRTPSASKEPLQPIRFESPINASPSRTLSERPRFISDSAIRENAKAPVVRASNTYSKYRLRPGYTFGLAHKSVSTLPPGTPGAYVYDSFLDDGDEDHEEEYDGGMSIKQLHKRMHVVDLVQRPENDDLDSVFERESENRWSFHSSQTSGKFQRDDVIRSSTKSDTLAYVSGKYKSSSRHSSSVFDGAPFLNAITYDIRKGSVSSLNHWDALLSEPTEIIPYTEVNLASSNRRKGLSTTSLEKYLSHDEFEQYLGTTREEFYKLPEFKRNDIKRKAKLF